MRVERYSKIKQSASRQKNIVRWVFAGAALVCFLCACALVVPLLTVRFIPPRYVARFVPQPLQVLFQPGHVDLPTPEANADSQQAGLLLTPIAVISPTAKQTSTPEMTQTAMPASSTPPVTATATPAAPTATFTPASFPGAAQAARNTPAVLSSATMLLSGFTQVYQTWNNCGPATLNMALSYYGWKGTQAQAAAFLKPDPEDRNVRPDEMAAFAESQGFRAIVRVNGSLDLLKALIRAGFPPIVEKGFEPEAKLGWMGHYELVTGWNEQAREFIVMDSYLGPNQVVSFDDMDRYWRQFDRTYIVVYKPDPVSSATVAQTIGVETDEPTMYRDALARTQSELAANPEDPYGWFDLGTDYAALKMYDESAAAYDKARQIGWPGRMTWYQLGWFDAYLAVNRTDDVIALADATIKSDPYAEEMYYYKGLALQKRGDTNGARAQFELALRHNPNFTLAKQALDALNS